MLIGFGDKKKGASAGGGAPTQAGDLIKDGTTASFMQDVVEASMTQPVLVDFWAEWCGPCKQLAPVIEAAVTAARGKIKLVKMNIDHYPEIAGQMGVQSIPAVFAFAGGRPVDGMMGAQPESQVKAFIDKLIAKYSQSSKDTQSLLEDAEQLVAQGEDQQAVALYQAILAEEPDHLGALAGYGLILLKNGQKDEVAALLESLDDEALKSAPVQRLSAALTLSEKLGETGAPEDLRVVLAANPDDCDSRFDLALALAKTGERAEVAEQLLTIIKQDRDWQEGKARKQLLEFFDVWGAKDPVTSSSRRKLSSLMFS